MTPGVLAAVAILVAIAVILGPLAALRLGSSQSTRLSKATPPVELEPQLRRLLPVLTHLPAELQQRHLQQVQCFIAGKHFVGCGGVEISDDMRLLVAGFACLLVLHPGAALFPAVRKILIYPSTFLVPVDEPDEFGLVDDEPQERIGESWQGDRVILSWEDVQAAAAGDETNVVVHEFAHQLDDESLAAEGAPQLADYSQWSSVMQREYERLRRHRRPPVLDPYGAESPAEFFGVVVEAFIQRGADLAQHHPQLYDLLRDTFGYDTRDWVWLKA